MNDLPIKPDLEDRLRLKLQDYQNQMARVEADLAELDRLAAAKGKRRGDRRSTGKDTQKYRLGSIFQFLTLDVEAIDDLAWLGFLSSSSSALALLNKCKDDDQNGSLVDLVQLALADPDVHGRARQHGAFLRWEWSRALYQAEVLDFAQSPPARDPRAAWRRKPATRRQIYLIGEAIRCFELDPPNLATRGEAYDWLQKIGGNPRFNRELQEKINEPN